jgi:hypothetical protein
MSDIRGDLFKRYDQLALEEEARRRTARQDKGVGSTQSLGDALTQAANRAAGLDKSLAAQTGSIGFNLDLALDAADSRARALGLDVAAVQERVRGIVGEGAALCDSPIEKRLLPWLVVENYGNKIETFPIRICDPKAQKLPPAGDLFIVPQMAFVKFRVDFALVCRLKTTLGIVAVECDGEQFHGAQRDTLRDGWLASFNIRTVRFSGKEITYNPRLCSARVAEQVMLMLEGE